MQLRLFKKLSTIFFITVSFSQLCYAQTAEFVDEIYAEINELKSKNVLPEYIPASVKSEESMNNLKLIFSKEEHNKIAKEFKHFQDASNEDIDKAYLVKISDKNQPKALSKENQAMLSKLSFSSTEFLKKNTTKQIMATTPMELNIKEDLVPINPKELKPVIAEIAPVKSMQNHNFIEESEEFKSSQRLTEATEILENDNKKDRYDANEDDSIFQIITKRYIKSYPKLKK